MTGQVLQLAFDEVGNAPTGPGIYAWYGVPAAGPEDWATEQALRNFLAFHTRRYVTPTLQLAAQTTFKRSWGGELDETTSRVFDRALGLVEDDGGDEPLTTEDQVKRKTLSAAVDRVCADGSHREHLVEALIAAIPMLASPLYVGISRTLRKRLLTHVRTFEKLAAEAPTDAELEDLLADDKNFAARAFSRGFSDSLLQVWCLPLSISDPNAADDMVKAVEFFLNRWHHPPLGRR